MGQNYKYCIYFWKRIRWKKFKLYVIKSKFNRTKHLSIELADKGVTVNSIAPGSIKHKGGSWEKFVNNSSSQEVSDFINQNLPMKDFGSPEPVGDMVSFLSSPRSFTITGACINIDGGQSSNLF